MIWLRSLSLPFLLGLAITEFSAALNQVATERGIPVESVLETIRTALVSAYRKDYGGDVDSLRAEVDPETGKAKIFENDKDVTPDGFGRIAAQTAKQVILQKIREKEKKMVFEEYKERVGSIVNGHIFRIDKKNIIMDLGKAQGIIPPAEQVPGEDYQINQRLKVFIKDVREGDRGTEIIISRADPKFVEGLFELEVPEIASGVVKIKAIAREAGSRTKLAVSSEEDNVDPVGSCVGQRGVRVQNIISELGTEKVDIIPYSEEIDKFIAASLSPAKVTNVDIDEKKRKALVKVLPDQLSLAIGKEGQNVRLAAKLTGWKIDIKGAEGLDISEGDGDTEGSDRLAEAQEKVEKEDRGKMDQEKESQGGGSKGTRSQESSMQKGDKLAEVAEKIESQDKLQAEEESVKETGKSDEKGKVNNDDNPDEGGGKSE